MAANHDHAGIAAWRAKLRAVCRSYQQYRDFLGDEPYKTIGPQMVVRWHASHISVVLYDTTILRIYPDDTFSADNGGYATLTTKYRLEMLTGLTFGHGKGKLYCMGRGRCDHDTRYPLAKESSGEGPLSAEEVVVDPVLSAGGICVGPGRTPRRLFLGVLVHLGFACRGSGVSTPTPLRQEAVDPAERSAADGRVL